MRLSSSESITHDLFNGSETASNDKGPFELIAEPSKKAEYVRPPHKLFVNVVNKVCSVYSSKFLGTSYIM